MINIIQNFVNQLWQFSCSWQELIAWTMLQSVRSSRWSKTRFLDLSS